MSKPEIVRQSDLSSLTCVSWRQMTSMWWISASDSMMWRFAADNPSTLSCMMRRAGPTAWKPRSALSEGFFLALWPGSIRIRSAGGIFGFPQLVYSPRYSRGGRRGRRLPSPPNYNQPIIGYYVVLCCKYCNCVITLCWWFWWTYRYNYTIH